MFQRNWSRCRRRPAAAKTKASYRGLKYAHAQLREHTFTPTAAKTKASYRGLKCEITARDGRAGLRAAKTKASYRGLKSRGVRDRLHERLQGRKN